MTATFYRIVENGNGQKNFIRNIETIKNLMQKLYTGTKLKKTNFILQATGK